MNVNVSIIDLFKMKAGLEWTQDSSQYVRSAENEAFTIQPVTLLKRFNRRK